jgi:formamidopyrimidine-DNA glycosylase
MPELPDVELYLHALRTHVVGRELVRVRLASPFLLRSVAPPLSSAAGREVVGVRRLGKRIVFELEGDLLLVLHLMVAGRLRWKPAGCKIPRRLGLAAFDFAEGSVLLTEAGTKKRASLHVVAGEGDLAAHDPGGLEVLESEAAEFTAALRAHSHTLKRALTDPRIVSGIGNAYSDEILHRARLSPFKRTQQLSEEESTRLFAATVATLTDWRDALIAAVGDGFPDKVTAFRPGMAVHGRYGEDCPVCGAPVQRILYAENEANYCVQCQTGGKLLADRVLSRLLKDDWPQTLEELEERRNPGSR